MNLRHAAALALVGWYLMVPPYHGDESNASTAAPLSEWRRGDYGETLDGCRQRQRQRIQEWKAHGQKAPKLLKAPRTGRWDSALSRTIRALRQNKPLALSISEFETASGLISFPFCL